MKVATAQAIVDQAESNAKENANAAQAPANESPIRDAIRKHQIIKGMTDDQVKQAMRYKSAPYANGQIWSAERTVEDLGDGRSICVWHIRTEYIAGQGVQDFEARVVTVTEENGTVVKVLQSIPSEMADREPDN
jgi:hypothetical protein